MVVFSVENIREIWRRVRLYKHPRAASRERSRETEIIVCITRLQHVLLPQSKAAALSLQERRAVKVTETDPSFPLQCSLLPGSWRSETLCSGVRCRTSGLLLKGSCRRRSGGSI